MAYADFTMDMLLDQFGLQTDEQGDYFADAPPAILGSALQTQLRLFVRRAIAIGTEKARSELIISPVLVEVVMQYPDVLGYFSGVEFSPDPVRGLRGVCDFLLSLSPEQLIVRAPVVAVAEAKSGNVKDGVAQCIAEMIAAQVFNQTQGSPISTLFGVVTTGTAWLFLRLNGNTVYLDQTEYHISQAEKIVGILLAMLREAASSLQS